MGVESDVHLRNDWLFMTMDKVDGILFRLIQTYATQLRWSTISGKVVDYRTHAPATHGSPYSGIAVSNSANVTNYLEPTRLTRAKPEALASSAMRGIG